MEMKKTKILGLILALIMFFTNLPFGSGIVHAEAGIKIDASNFPDENFRKYVSEMFDTDKNKYLDSNEILAADFINPTDSETSSLKGIEYFTNMKTLSFDNIKITELDLSNSTSLEELYCSSSLLTSLDLRKNTKLKKIFCNYNSKLKELILGYMPELTEFRCKYNIFEDLDFSKCTNLQTLDCTHNNLNSLNLSNNPELDWICCDDNPISELDLSNNSKLWMVNCSENKELSKLILGNNPNLNTLNCSDNALEELDLSNCPKLQELDCAASYVDNNRGKLKSIILGNNPGLTKIICSNNIIEELDLSKCPNLKELSVVKNELTALDLTNNTNLEKLSCYYNKLSSLTLGNNPKLEVINCYENQLEQLDLEHCPELITLVCENNRIKSIDLSKNKELKYLNLYGNELKEIITSSNEKLEEINCDNNDIEKLDLSKNKALTKISCSKNIIKDLDLKNNTLLKDLSCSENQLTELDLDNNINLEKLYCDKNKLSSLDLTNNKNISSMNGSGQSYTVTLAQGINKIKASDLPGKFDLSRVKFENGITLDKDNDQIILVDNLTNATFRYNAKNNYDTRCYIEVKLNIVRIDQTVIVQDYINPELTPIGYVRLTFDATQDGTIGRPFDEIHKKYIDVKMGTAWTNQELQDVIPKKITYKDKSKVFYDWEDSVPTEGNVVEKIFTAKYKEKVYDSSKFTEVTVVTPAKMKYIEGEALDLTKLVLELKDSEDAYKKVAFTEFANNSITVQPVNGTKLELSNNDTELKITVGNAQPIVIGKLTVNPRPIIGPVNPKDQNDEKPTDLSLYYIVSFVSEDETKGTVIEKNTIYVSKKAKVKLSEIIARAPETKASDGNKFNGWKVEPQQEFTAEIKDDITVKATFSELEIIIGPKDPTKEDGKNPKPEKYHKVSFKSDAKMGTIAKENTFYVLKESGKKMSDLEVPEVTPEYNYIFEKWDPEFSKDTLIEKDLEFTAKFIKLKEIIGPFNPEDQNAEKPIDSSKYWTVTFESADTSKGTVDKNNTFYVLKTGHNLGDLFNKEPDTTPADGYVFDRWEPKVTVYTPIDRDLVVKAIFKEKGEIQEPTDPKIIGPVDPNAPAATIPSPNEYWTVTFVSEDTNKGTVDAANTFYIPMTESKKLSDLKAPAVTAKSGFEFEKWDLPKDTAIDNNLTVIAIFKAQGTVNPPVEPSIPSDNIIGPVDSESNLYKELDKHKDEYYKLIFDDNDYIRIYVLFVKKGQGIRLTDIAAYAPNVVADEGYVFTGWSPMLYGNTELIENDRYIVAEFEEIGRPYRPYWPDYREERPYRPYRPYRHYEDDRDTEPVVEEKPVEVNEYDKLEAILFINDTMMQKSVNGVVSQVRMDIAPFIYQARTMLPIRYVAESLGFMVTWDANTRTVYLVDKENIVQIPVDTNNIIVNGKAFVSDVKPMIKNNRTMLPVANVARALGLQDGKDILWDAAMKFVTLRRNVLK